MKTERISPVTPYLERCGNVEFKTYENEYSILHKSVLALRDVNKPTYEYSKGIYEQLPNSNWPPHVASKYPLKKIEIAELEQRDKGKAAFFIKYFFRFGLAHSVERLTEGESDQLAWKLLSEYPDPLVYTNYNIDIADKGLGISSWDSMTTATFDRLLLIVSKSRWMYILTCEED